MIGVLLLLLRLAAVALVLFVIWRLLKPQWAFKIVVDEAGVRSHTGVQTPQQRRLLQMFEKTRFVEGRVTIRGRSDVNGRLQLQFSGNISDEGRQQIRNFVVNEL